MSAPRIEDAEEVVIGIVYDVPAVHWIPQAFRVRPSWVDVITPVFGALHEDRETIGFDEDHWHIDWRFASSQLLQRMDYEAGLDARTRTELQASKVISAKDTDGKVLRIRRRCKRQHITFPTTYNAAMGYERVVPWMPLLELAYSESVVKCGRCPHRGMSLAGAPVVDGARVCPGHGLAWNVETGKLQRRTA